MLASAVALDLDVAPPVLARVAVMTDLAAARAPWRDLLRRAPCSPYQTDRWLLPWIDNVGREQAPTLAFGFDRADVPIAMLPLGLTRHAGLTVARFLGGRDSNTGLGLFDPRASFDAATLRSFLDAVAREAAIDLFVLRNQPAVWDGYGNPFGALPHRISPSRQHEADLGRSAESFFAATLSKSARKHIRQKEAKLAAIDAVAHRIAGSRDEAEQVATWLIERRAERFGAAEGRDGALRRMLVAATESNRGEDAAVELHALLCGSAIVSALAVATHASRMSGMLLAFDPDWSRHSPGELLVARVVADACRRGFASFDLGIGEARYKDTFCPRAEPLFDTILGITRRGRLVAGAYHLHGAVKREIKQSRHWVWIARQRAFLTRLGGLVARRR